MRSPAAVHLKTKMFPHSEWGCTSSLCNTEGLPWKRYMDGINGTVIDVQLTQAICTNWFIRCYRIWLLNCGLSYLALGKIMTDLKKKKKRILWLLKSQDSFKLWSVLYKWSQSQRRSYLFSFFTFFYCSLSWHCPVFYSIVKCSWVS